MLSYKNVKQDQDHNTEGTNCYGSLVILRMTLGNMNLSMTICSGINQAQTTNTLETYN